MIRISKLADYAVVILAEMARDPAVLSATAFASATSLSETTVAKVLKVLAQNQILVARRGSSGGYELARQADAISLCQIIEAMDGPIGIVDCAEESRVDCQLIEKCRLQANWSLVNDKLRYSLLHISLRDMMQSMGGALHNVVRIAADAETA
jgi:FeS assembly SUF system regulator